MLMQRYNVNQRHVFIWTDDAIETLRMRWLTGDSAAQIAGLLKTSKNAVIGKAHRLNLPARPSPIPWTAEQMEQRRIALEVGLQAAREHEAQAAAERNAKRKPPEAPAPEPVAPPPPKPRPSFSAAAIPNAKECCWPLNDGRPNWLWCGAPVAYRSYCEEHAERSYQRRRKVAA